MKERQNTPILLQDSKHLVGVEVVDEDFERVFVKLASFNKTVYVKRKLRRNHGHKKVDIIANLVDLFTNKAKKNYDLRTLGYILAKGHGKDQNFTVFLNKFKGNTAQMLVCEGIFAENVGESLIWDFIKEDRLEFVESFFILNRKYKDFSQVSAEFIREFHIVHQIYELLPLWNKETSKLLNSSIMKNIENNLKERVFMFKKSKEEYLLCDNY